MSKTTKDVGNAGMKQNRKKDVLVFGHFGFGTTRIGGQTTKTNVIFRLVSERLGSDVVELLDTERGIRIISPKNIYRLIKAERIIYIPGRNSLLYFLPILSLLRMGSVRGLVIVPVGGWLLEFLAERRFYCGMLKKALVVLPQVSAITVELQRGFGIGNVKTLRNFRSHEVVARPRNTEDFRIIFLARICPEKGVKFVFDLAEHFLKVRGDEIVRIDFWGPISDVYYAEFMEGIASFDNVRYRGILMQSEIGSVMPDYDLLVLPTAHSGEGVPGSIIDAFVCGVPVVASRWKFIPEIVYDGENGFLFESGKSEAFIEKVEYLYDNPLILKRIRDGAKRTGELYSSEHAWKVLREFL